MILESKIQSKLIKDLELNGWYVVRLIQTNKNGIADLLCLHKKHGVKFVEVKAKKGKIATLQKYRAKEIFDKTGIDTQFYL